jgi:hypothetical protein
MTSVTAHPDASQKERRAGEPRLPGPGSGLAADGSTPLALRSFLVTVGHTCPRSRTRATSRSLGLRKGRDGGKRYASDTRYLRI